MNENLDRSDVSLPVSHLLEIDSICRQFEAAWKAGQQPKADDFLGRMEGPARSQLRKDLAAIEAELRGSSPAAGQSSTKKTPAEKTSSAGPSFEEFTHRLTESGLMTDQEFRQFVDSLPPHERPTAAERIGPSDVPEGPS